MARILEPKIYFYKINRIAQKITEIAILSTTLYAIKKTKKNETTNMLEEVQIKELVKEVKTLNLGQQTLETLI